MSAVEERGGWFVAALLEIGHRTFALNCARHRQHLVAHLSKDTTQQVIVTIVEFNTFELHSDMTSLNNLTYRTCHD